MTINISRRKFIGTTSAGITAAAIAGSPAVLAQDDKPTVKIGSKNYTEQIILGELLSQLLENDGYPVERQLNLGGTMVAFEALLNGDIDAYVEATGTGLIAVLGLDLPESADAPETNGTSTPATGSGGRDQKVYDIVAEAYPEEFGVEWLDPFGYNNTWVLAMRREHAEGLGITKISDLKPHAGDFSIGTDAESAVRDDGIPGLESSYGLEFGDPKTMDLGLLYSAVAEGELDVILGGSTDGRIKSMDLVVLEDDLGFFPPYWGAPIVRMDTLEETPEIRDVLNQLAGKIDDDRMMEMNFLADGEGMEPADIVRDFLIEEGIVEE